MDQTSPSPLARLKAPRVAFVHDFLLRMGGAERVLQVMMELYPEAPVFTILYDEKKMGGIFPKERVRCSSLQKWPRFLPGMHKLLFPWMPGAVEEFDLSGYDVVISSSGAYSHGVVTNLDTVHLVYYHSPMRYAWDYTHAYLKEQQLGLFGEALIARLLHRVRMWDFLAGQRCQIPLANSRTVQDRIRKYYRRESEVLFPPVELARFHPHAKHEGYFLIVSQLTRYKRIDLAIELFNKLGKRLVVIGTGSDAARLKGMAASNIDFLGYKSDEVVKEYMENCRAFIFPGEEDFGIAAVEAMACGKPVLAYRKGGLTETVLEGVTGEFFNELTVESMEAGLTQLLIHEKNYHADKIAAHAQNFNRARFEARLQELVEGALVC